MLNDLTQLELKYRQALSKEHFVRARELKKRLEELRKLYLVAK